ncbi:hypothetical protein [Vreelandella venusta]|uniref:hypothetical protein n=1 Tax=Vreelandella venusta TaxID=44935 RepID=UPI003AA8519B
MEEYNENQQVQYENSPAEAASSLRKWALDKNLLQPLPNQAETKVTGGIKAAPIGAEAESILRSKGLVSISYNEQERIVYIYTKRKVTKAQLKVLPLSHMQCSILYPQGSIEDIGSQAANSQGTPYHTKLTTSGALLYACGSSISPGNSFSAGTLGSLVMDANGQLHGLSNNHVTGACSHSPHKLPIMAPGVVDVTPYGIDPFTLGHHAKVLEMRAGTVGNIDVFENSDAAIFSIKDRNMVTSMQGNFYDTPSQVTDPIEGMLVEKVGRTTGHTKGRIVGRELTPLNVHSTASNYGFSASIWFAHLFTIHGLNDLFSDGGDSGSLIVTTDQKGEKHAVGLLFAGGGDSTAPGGKRTLMLPLKPILQKLGVTLVSGHNVQ